MPGDRKALKSNPKDMSYPGNVSSSDLKQVAMSDLVHYHAQKVHFLLCSKKHPLPFYRVLSKAKDFTWDKSCQQHSKTLEVLG
ncbi:UNVERIFIED_CONTAM: hypothetical protein Sangu_0319800 [Sesamum angustifolium]|uniref:Uncharacterized protein n=1 Tax=Sesamum angustifolium TaxID=2727405 RepID=A0AAW2QPY1_9LAMI